MAVWCPGQDLSTLGYAYINAVNIGTENICLSKKCEKQSHQGNITT